MTLFSENPMLDKNSERPAALTSA
ncbi:hypothetical protein AGR1A_Cc50276 [Agrobacterium fabacearum CFBP 5771]|nr:hypothetical protein AGR1B_Cc10328 [Agrobacterium fabacearum S56]CVI18325.1 hypothetical protein AGR1A_Cc50276 [Agrobacterium fabacearum CFBP 5771]